MVSEVQRVPHDRSLIQALVPVQGSEAEQNLELKRDQTGPQLVKYHDQAHARRVREKNAVMLLAERTVEKRVLERHHELLRAIIDVRGLQPSEVLENETLSHFINRGHTQPTRVVLESLYRLISDSQEQDTQRKAESFVAEIYRRMAILPILLERTRKHSVDIYV